VPGVGLGGRCGWSAWLVGLFETRAVPVGLAGPVEARVALSGLAGPVEAWVALFGLGRLEWSRRGRLSPP
jgi:hypothetical protein